MTFTVLIPARLGSTRLSRKPLADIAGLPMVVRVAQRAAKSLAARVVVATDHSEIQAVCHQHGVEVAMTSPHHATGSDRLAEACAALGLDGQEVVVNVQGDEPLIDPAVINACAQCLPEHPDCVMSTVAHVIRDFADLHNPSIVKLVCDVQQRALYFSRAPIPWWRDGYTPAATELCQPAPLRHVGLYAYQAWFLRSFHTLTPSSLEAIESLEQLRVLWHGHRIAVHVSDKQPSLGVDTQADLEQVRALCTN
jgi:3-deoxy-manno-octulosonate cytidylyltransferase (CMP-KDO synthetase)